MIEKQTVLARGIEAQLGVSGTGTEQVAVLFELTEGPNKGQRITWFGFFTEKTQDRTLESLEHCGWSGETLQDLSGISRNEVELEIDHEPDFKDPTKTRARVQWVNKPGGRSLAVKQAMTETEVASFDRRMKAALLERKQKRANAGPGDASFGFGANAAGDKPPV